MTFVGADTLSVLSKKWLKGKQETNLGVPHAGRFVLSGREEKIALSVEADAGQRSIVALQRKWAHLVTAKNGD